MDPAPDFSRRDVLASPLNGSNDAVVDLRLPRDHPSPEAFAADIRPLEARELRRSDSQWIGQYSIAVLVPCRNEEVTIATVVRDFKCALPTAEVYVYDNGSNDRSAEVARDAGAHVRREPRSGKGNVVRRMFSDIDADVYVMVDGDDTYDAQVAPRLIQLFLEDRVDMLVGRRVANSATTNAYRRGHRFGNWLLTSVVQRLFGRCQVDMLSGYRVLSNRYVKSFPVTSSGFEIETEMTVHALDLHLPVLEVPTVYSERPSNSHSKLRTIPDGLKILIFIALLLKEYRPAALFGFLAACFASVGLLVTTTSHPIGPGFPSGQSLVSIELFMFAGISSAIAIILTSVRRGRRETKRLMYLSVPRPDHVVGRARLGDGGVGPAVTLRGGQVGAMDVAQQ